MLMKSAGVTGMAVDMVFPPSKEATDLHVHAKAATGLFNSLRAPRPKWRRSAKLEHVVRPSRRRQERPPRPRCADEPARGRRGRARVRRWRRSTSRMTRAQCGIWRAAADPRSTTLDRILFGFALLEVGERYPRWAQISFVVEARI